MDDLAFARAVHVLTVTHRIDGVAFVIAVILFVSEPLLLRGWFHRRMAADPAATLRHVQRAHAFLLLVGTTIAAAGMLGAHGLPV